jgi:ubiquinone/menaquinone biosynthesis C-methylase UbiE
MAEQPYVDFDPVAQDYDISRGIPPDAQRRMSERMRDAANWQSGDIFLDAGAGTGRFAVPLARLGVPVVGLEISANMLAQMRANRETACREEKADLPLRAARGDLRRMPVASRAFKAVVIVHILHLIADWKAVLAEVERILTPGGVLLMAKSGGQDSPARAFYLSLVRERGLFAPEVGAQWEEVYAYLAGQGAQIEKVDMSDITWTARRPLSLTLELLRRRTWSSLRHISDAENAALLAETTAWAIQRYGTLDILEEAEGTCSLTTVRWS